MEAPITTKESDKGSAVVLMDTECYKNFALIILENGQFYEKAKTYREQMSLKDLTL